MRSDIFHFLCLGKNFEQIIIRQEIESSENASLGFKIISETSLNDFKVSIGFLESLEKTFSGACFESIWVLNASSDTGFPNFIDSLEFFVFRWKLLHDIWGIENWLEIHPLTLAFHPLIDTIGDVEKSLVPLFNFILKWFLEWGELHGLSQNDMLIKHEHSIIETSNGASSGVLERLEQELNCCPVALHLGHGGLNVVFFSSFLTDINDGFGVVSEVHVHTVLEGEALLRLDFKSNVLGEDLPMSVFHSLGSQSHNDWHLWLEHVNSTLNVISNFADSWKVFVSEESENLSHGLVGKIHCVFDVLGIDVFKRVIQPLMITCSPCLDCGPEIIIWLIVLSHLRNRSVVRDVLNSNK